MERKTIILFLALSLIGCGMNKSEHNPDATNLQVANSVVDNLTNGNFEQVNKDFDENLKAALDSNKIREMWEEIISKVGSFEF